MASWGGVADKDSLVEQIKNLQRNDPAAKEHWNSFVEAHGEGKRDPSRHEAPFLQTFLQQLQSGALASAPAGLGGSVNLADTIKTLQKRSPNFKQAWASVCAVHGGGYNDPAKHDANFHTKFFDALAEGFLAWSAGGGVVGAGDGPPAKRMRDNTGMALAISSGDPVKDALVQQVKAYQRIGEAQKGIWGQYADTYLGGTRDPNRHDASMLKDFCQMYGVPAVDPSSNFLGGGVGMGGMPALTAPEDPVKAGLVERVKMFQKQSEQNREAWGQFAGRIRDPNRHEVDRLQEFCMMQSI